MAIKSGVLAPITCLPGNHGIGDFGETAYEFVDILYENNYDVWQILPLNPSGFGNSPYQPFSAYAGDEIYISLNKLMELSLIDCVENCDNLTDISDYDSARLIKNKYLEIAFSNIDSNIKLSKEFNEFKKSVHWLDNYAVFITLKKENENKCWVQWDLIYKNWTENKINFDHLNNKFEYQKFIQYIFFKQWFSLKKYANSKKISIMGDVPIYMGLDSADVWNNKKDYLLDNDGNPTCVAGVPPDYFSATGQRWGNPIYDWDYLKKDNFKFWVKRLNWNDALYDIIRIDHFRAFDTYWKINVNCDTAVDGVWCEALGYDLLDEIYNKIPNINIVVEDLGLLRDEVIQLKNHYKLSGMKVMQFELNPNTKIQNFNFDKNTIIYTGTHDNQTLVGWFNSLSIEQQNNLCDQYSCDLDNCAINIINNCFELDVNIVIIPIQDILLLDDNARFNTPGIIGGPNWKWKLKSLEGLNRKFKLIKNKRNSF